MKIEIEQMKGGHRTVLTVDWPAVPRMHEMVEVQPPGGSEEDRMRGWVALVTWAGDEDSLLCRVVLGTIGAAV